MWQQLLRRHFERAKKPLIVVVGPTASGKTNFSLDIAKEIGNAEIVSADSRQLYRGLDIGTAKIKLEEMRGIPHHLIDVVDPNEEVTIAWYQEQVHRVITSIHARMAVPILVGGSMLYISAVVDGLQPLPVAPPELRKKLEEEYDRDDGWTLYEKLQRVDPKTAAAFDQMNKVYVVRALELYELTGHPPSLLKKTVPPPYDILLFGVRRPQQALAERIEERTRQMLRSGWIEEVEGLLDRGCTMHDPAMKSHGYKEIAAWLGSEERNLDELTRVIAAKTKQYAKRQVTWWKDDSRIHWVDAS